MPVEIERKFLVLNDSWRAHVTRSERLRDGLVAASDDRKVRVRLYEDRATLTVKTKQERGRRQEFEYEIPHAHALEMLALCAPTVIEKTRHHVPHRGRNWELDVYEGLLQGVVLAEVELASIDQPVAIPDWAGAEVTDRPEYKKINLLRERMARRERPISRYGT
jgi:adenylate cyclase